MRAFGSESRKQALSLRLLPRATRAVKRWMRSVRGRLLCAPFRVIGISFRDGRGVGIGSFSARTVFTLVARLIFDPYLLVIISEPFWLVTSNLVHGTIS